MDTRIPEHLHGLKMGELQQHKNMAVVPLFASGRAGPAYITLTDALERGLLSVTEVSDSHSPGRSAGRSVILRISPGDQRRILGPQVPVPRQTITVMSPTSYRPASRGYSRCTR